jgi:excisionase family DNA binding protein
MAWKLIDLNQLRSVRIGRAVRVRPEDLEEFLADPARER